MNMFVYEIYNSKKSQILAWQSTKHQIRHRKLGKSHRREETKDVKKQLTARTAENKKGIYPYMPLIYRLSLVVVYGCFTASLSYTKARKYFSQQIIRANRSGNFSKTHLSLS
ncbi:MAG: hypothetical protein RI893_1081 [Pseudomonadota bacterium]